jgi:hypothetical protein
MHRQIVTSLAVASQRQVRNQCAPQAFSSHDRNHAQEASMRKLALAGISAAALLSLPVNPGHALSIQPQPVASTGGSHVIDVKNHWRKRNNWNRNWNRHGDRRWNRHGDRRWYRHRHRNRHDDDWWWGPAAGFGLGLLLGTAPRYYEYPTYRTAPAYRVVPGNAAHIAWCEDRYRSYRVSDNTFQPYNGPRRQCISPYM